MRRSLEMIAVLLLRVALCVYFLSTIVTAFPCRVNSCIRCSSTPVNCTVTLIDEDTYNYYCEAPEGCTPQNVSGLNDRDGYYCNANLFIRNLNSTDFNGNWFNFEVGHTCEEVSGFDVNVGYKVRHKLTNNCLNITETVSSLERINIPCFCKGDNCQDVFNVTITIDPPDDVNSSTLINEVMTSSSSPSSVPLSLSSSTVDLKSSSLTSPSTSSVSFSVVTSPTLAIATTAQTIATTSSVIPSSTGFTTIPSNTTVTILSCKSIKCYE